MKKIIFLVLLAVFVFGNISFAQYRPRPHRERERNYNTLPQDNRELKFNPFSGRWSYEDPGSKLRHNPHEGTWEFKRRGETFRFNPFSGKWE